MRIYIYADTPAARTLRDKLRAERHTAILCNPEFYSPADLKEIDVAYFPKDHRLAEQVEKEAATASVTVEWITKPKTAKTDGDKPPKTDGDKPPVA